MMPTALIDLPSLQIKKMHAYNEYVMFRREYRELELDKLFKTRSAQRLPEFGQCVTRLDAPPPWLMVSPRQSLFTAVRKPSPYIVTMLQEVMRVERFMRERLLHFEMQRLHRKAVLMVRYVEAELCVARRAGSFRSAVLTRVGGCGAAWRATESRWTRRRSRRCGPTARGHTQTSLGRCDANCKVERNPDLLPDLILELFESF